MREVPFEGLIRVRRDESASHLSMKTWPYQ